jgi:hypothetical protein
MKFLFDAPATGFTPPWPSRPIAEGSVEMTSTVADGL